jgi:glycosyltransferase involved in cell wall biosynthesis
VGTYARLYRQKRLDLLLDALAELRRRSVAVRGLVIGAGPLLATLREQADRLRLDDVVEIDDRPHDAAAALRRIDVFALTSSHEVGPLTVMEAMAAERAVVTTGVGVVPEIVEDGRTALAVPPGDVAAFADALQRVVEDVTLRTSIARAARAEARRSFGAHVMAEKLEAVYAGALERRRR